MNSHEAPRSPATEAEARALLAEARQKLAELQALCETVQALAATAKVAGRALTRDETSAVSRAAYLARYVADCAHRAAAEPPKRRRGTPTLGFALTNIGRKRDP